MELQLDRETVSKAYILMNSVHRKVQEKDVCNLNFLFAAHPFYVLNNFIDVGLIDLDLLPGNAQTDGLSWLWDTYFSLLTQQ